MSNTRFNPREHKRRPTIRMGEVLTEEWETSPDSTAPLTSPIYDESKGPTTADVVTSAIQNVPGVDTLESIASGAVAAVKYLPWILGGVGLFVVYVYVSSYGRATARITHPLG